MKASELRSKDAEGLQKEMKELQRAQFNLRMQKGTQALVNPMQLRTTRRSIARAKTILAQKQAAAK